jgi:hypothetical protein
MQTDLKDQLPAKEVVDLTGEGLSTAGSKRTSPDTMDVDEEQYRKKAKQHDQKPGPKAMVVHKGTGKQRVKRA